MEESEGNTSSKPTKKIPKSLSDAEYEDIFSAVLSGYTSDTGSGDPLRKDAAAAYDDTEACDDFDAVLEEAAQEDFDQPEDDAGDDQADVNGDHDALEGPAEDPEDVNLENMPDEIRAEITRLTNELTPAVTDEEDLNDSTSAPPKPKQKKNGSDKKDKMKPKTLDFTPGKDLAQTEPVIAKKIGSIGLGNPADVPVVKGIQPKKETVAKVSKKQRMQERAIEEYGVWVQCTEINCLKWRYLEHVHDPAVLPDKWICFMNPDKAHNSCEKAEESWNQDEHDRDYVFAKYTEGSVVWAKMVGYPWWPALVEIDPDEETYFSCDLQDRIATRYHVVFFDAHVTRAWVGEKFVMPFTGQETSYLLGSTKTKGTDYKKQVNEARARATSALDLSLKDRLAAYGFCHRYQGKWGKEVQSGCQESQSSVPRKKRKKQSKQKPKAEVLNSEEHDLDDILDNAEAIIQNAEYVLDEFFSQPESGLPLSDNPASQVQKKKKKKKLNDKKLARKQQSDEQTNEKRKKKNKLDKMGSKIKNKKVKKTSNKEQNEKPSKQAKADSKNVRKVKPVFKTQPVRKPADKPGVSKVLKEKASSPKIGITATAVEEEMASKRNIGQQKIQFDSDVYTMEMASQGTQEEGTSKVKETVEFTKPKESMPVTSSQIEYPPVDEKNRPEKQTRDHTCDNRENNSELVGPTQMQTESKKKPKKPAFVAPGLNKRAGIGLKGPRTSTPNKRHPPTIDKRGVPSKNTSPPPKKQKLQAGTQNSGTTDKKQAKRKKQNVNVCEGDGELDLDVNIKDTEPDYADTETAAQTVKATGEDSDFDFDEE